MNSSMTSLMFAGVFVLITGCQPALGQDKSVEEFLALYRPKAAALADHLFRNVEVAATYSAAWNGDYKNLKVLDRIEFVSNADRFRYVLWRHTGRCSVMILRPDALYNPYSPAPGEPFVLSKAQVVPESVRDRVAGAEWGMIDEIDEAHGMGIGLHFLRTNLYQGFVDGTFRIDAVRDIDATEVRVDAVATKATKPIAPLAIQFYFRKPLYIMYRAHTSWPIEGRSAEASVDYEFKYNLTNNDILS